MFFKWLDASEATQAGASLADDFYLHTSGASEARREETRGPQGQELQKFLQKFLQQVDRAAQPLKLNFFKRAKLAHSFKWRLLDKGVDKDLVEELTQALVRRLAPKAAPAVSNAAPREARGRTSAGEIRALQMRATESLARGAYDRAVELYQELTELDPRHVPARNGLGSALAQLARYDEAEEQFRRAIGIKAGSPDAHYGLGTLLRWRGRFAESEAALRRAVKLQPLHLDAQIGLGTTLAFLGRLSDATVCYEKVLRTAPRNVQALVGLGQVAALEGRFDEARATLERALQIEPRTASAWAWLARMRRMTKADAAWLKGAEESAANASGPVDEATIRYAIGKYHDDVGDYTQAFRSYQRANELQKELAEPYQREARSRFVDDLIRLYPPEHLSRRQPGASDSEVPVLVVGMMRSGTSLVEQIIASHPSAKGAGELDFWSGAVRKHEAAIRGQQLGASDAERLAAAYLKALTAPLPEARRVVDKTTVNSDYLGLIHGVFPRARIIYVQRDPVDTCLSCYFEQLSTGLNFTMDLADLAHYYREHRRLIGHWRKALPPGTLLDVPYEALISDPEQWSRRIMDFIGLEWDARCLEFERTERSVLTASFWQVRQKIYGSSVGRWRHYEKFIGPLKSLADLSG